jgi:hypothetical protein
MISLSRGVADPASGLALNSQGDCLAVQGSKHPPLNDSWLAVCSLSHICVLAAGYCSL